MRRRSLLATAGAAAAFPGGARASDEPVDVALVLAVDVSRSVDENEARLQREGYRNAITDPRVVEAIRGNMLGSVAIAYVEWAGMNYQRVLIPWTRIASQRDAEAWASILEQAPRTSLTGTSISGALDFSRRTMGDCPHEATRRVIDVSGDGVNNSGPRAEPARDRAVAEGIVINGLPILNDSPGYGYGYSPIPLDDYYRNSVIGGSGAFVIAADDFESFGQAVRRKLIREIAGVAGPGVVRG